MMEQEAINKKIGHKKERLGALDLKKFRLELITEPQPKAPVLPFYPKYLRPTDYLP